MTIPFYEDVAVLLLSELALSRTDKAVPLSVIAKKHGVSLQFLKKIVRLLRGAGFVTSREGVNGGYLLAVNPDSTTLWSVFTAIDQSRQREIGKVDTLSPNCPLTASCLPEIIRNSVRGEIKKSLNAITISSLLANVAYEK